MAKAKQSTEGRLAVRSEEFAAALRALDAVARKVAADLVAECNLRDVSDDTFRQVQEFNTFWVADDSFLEMSDWAESLTGMILRSKRISGSSE